VLGRQAVEPIQPNPRDPAWSQRDDAVIQLPQDGHVQIAEIAWEEKTGYLARPIGEYPITSSPAVDDQMDVVGAAPFANDISLHAGKSHIRKQSVE
jgi:hypothetical protein